MRASGPESALSGPNNADASHASTSRENMIKPATAATESWKPMSKATGGYVANAKHTAADRPATESTLRPVVIAMAAKAAISHARTAEGCTPLATT